MPRLDVCERTRQEIQRDGGPFCKACGWTIHEHRQQPAPLSGDPKAIAAVAEAIRVAEGRGKWQTAEMPGTDAARARAVLQALDVFIANRGEL